jgi:hypothetical protein
MAKKPTRTVRYRDSVDGQFITKKEAEKRPRETEKEVVKPSPKRRSK